MAPQAPLVVPDTTSANTRAAQNAANHALATQSAGPSAPPNPVEGQLWRDTSGSNDVLKVYESGSWNVTAWGSTGPRGPRGSQGPRGPQGTTGPRGAAGARGPKGDTGNAGPRGAQGVAGPPGEAGTPAVGSLTDSEIGGKAFRHPPSDLTTGQQSSVRSAIDAASEAGAREGIFEMSSGSDQGVQDTLHIAEKNSDLIRTGTKYYVSGGTAGGLKGKLIRRTSTAFGTVSEQDWRDNFSDYWETILDSPSGGGAGTDQTARDAAAAAQTTADAAKGVADAALPRAGGTMGGPLLLNGQPTQPLEAATKGYVDAQGGGGTVTPAQAYSTLMKDASNNNLTSAWKGIPLGDNPTVNQGTFTASGQDLTVGVAGQYLISGQVSANTSSTKSANRVRLECRARLTRSADNTHLNTNIGSAYIRNQYTETQRNIAAFTSIMTFAAGDKVQLQARAVRQDNNDTVTILSGDSSLSVALIGSTTAGPAGGVTVQTTAALSGDGSTSTPLGLADGGVDLDALAAAVVQRLIPPGGDDGDVLIRQGSGTFWRTLP